MAIPSIADLRARFPEFGTTSSDGAPDALVQRAIDHAAEICDATVYGDRQTQAILWTAADDLARSPFARDLKMVSKDGSTVYQARTKQLMRIAAAGLRGF